LEVTGSPEALPEIRSVIRDQFALEAIVQPTQDDSLLIRLATITPETHQNLLAALREKRLIREELRYESIGPTIGAELRRKAWLAVGLAVVVLILYLTYTFRQMRGFISSWKFGVATVLATLHDISVVAACFTLFGAYWGTTVDTLFVTALLAILGYSVNDTIVLFTRFLQEWRLSRVEPFFVVLDRAARATLMRSLNTSLAILLVLTVLLIFGGATIRWFIVALTLGTLVGTYSSIYVAPFILYYLARPRQ
jgi:preprotein translocase subunit SecF